MITVRRLCEVCAAKQGHLTVCGFSMRSEAESSAKGVPPSTRIASATLQQALAGAA